MYLNILQKHIIAHYWASSIALVAIFRRTEDTSFPLGKLEICCREFASAKFDDMSNWMPIAEAHCNVMQHTSKNKLAQVPETCVAEEQDGALKEHKQETLSKFVQQHFDWQEA